MVDPWGLPAVGLMTPPTRVNYRVKERDMVLHLECICLYPSPSCKVCFAQCCAAQRFAAFAESTNFIDVALLSVSVDQNQVTVER
jgi:hypothetical protein